MSSAIDDFYDFHKDVVKNTSTGLMAINASVYRWWLYFGE